MIPATFGSLVALLISFFAGAAYGWWLHRMERAELRQALRNAAGLVESLRMVAPLAMTALRRRSIDFADRWRE
ncbi:hypothetical protein [Stenotrophomonas maltophilia]|uniref:hypothetical protein n=1 Tax=Stenotrophomonas maltophilia TaxID=40324 RepID=UPI002B1D741B|nr:hypothetical protein [Stenotrophomonas maltophilia]